jgi:hypothetical protein
MIKKILLLLLLSATLSAAFAQFEVNKHYAGPMVGLSFLGSTLQIGGGHEYGIEIQNFGSIGVGGLVRYWSYSENFGLGQLKYKGLLMGVQGNYHFDMDDRRFDPWGGLVLAFDAGSVEYSGPAGFPHITPSYGGRIWLGLHGGLRYWVQPNLAFSGRIGFGTMGYGALDFGVDFKF